MNFPHFMHLPTASSSTSFQRSVYIDNMSYDHFLLSDLTRCAAIIVMSENINESSEFLSTDDIFDKYLRFAKANPSILDYFLTHFERILTMYIHARFGNLLTVVIERVKEPIVKFPIGCFVDHSNLIIIYSPEKLTEYVDRLSMSIFLYSSEKGFIRNREGDNVFNSRAMQEHEERLKAFLSVEQSPATAKYYQSFNNSLPEEFSTFFSGITGFASDKTQLSCDRFMPVVSPLDQLARFDMISYSATRPCLDENDQYTSSEDAVFLTTNYLASKKMMLGFNAVFKEQNKSHLLFLSAIRTLLSTAIRPVVDLFIVKSDNKVKEHKDGLKKRTSGGGGGGGISSNRLGLASTTPAIIKSGKLVPQYTTIVEHCKYKHVEMIDSSLRQQRLNIEVCVRQ